jgi:Uma2 family endonuclease
MLELNLCMTMQPQLFSVDDYLQGELHAKLRHEFVDGQVFAMAGASASHNRICIRALMALEPMALAAGCMSFMADMKLRVRDCVYYPDLMVICALECPAGVLTLAQMYDGVVA